MGTGKTAAGKMLAKRLKMEFIDLDDRIEEKEGRTISRIFKEDGEAYFRRIEKDTVKGILGIKDSVLATGGGVVMDDENMVSLKKIGTVISLVASPEVILKRTSLETHRPLLNNAEPKKNIEELLKRREPFYKKADYIIDTSSLNIDEVVDEILKILKMEG